MQKHPYVPCWIHTDNYRVKYGQLCSKIRDLIISIPKKLDDYDKKYVKNQI